MKQFTHVLISMICIIACSFSSCGLMHTEPAEEVFDKSFKESFSQQYWRAEPNLIYVSASNSGVRVNIEPEQSYEYSAKYYGLAEIHNIQDQAFVGTIEKTSLLYGETEYSLSIYTQGKPIPALLAWTVESVSVLALTTNEFSTVSFHGENLENQAQPFIKNPLQYHLDHGAIELVTFTREDYAEQIDSLEESYASRRLSDAIGSFEVTVKPDEAAKKSMACFVLIRFEEIDELVWVARLYQDADGDHLYLDCSDYTDHETLRLAEIDPAFAQIILAQINS